MTLRFFLSAIWHAIVWGQRDLRCLVLGHRKPKNGDLYCKRCTQLYKGKP